MGLLYTDSRFASIAINLFDITEVEATESNHVSIGTTGRRLIVAPAMDADEAQHVLNRLNIQWMEDFTGIPASASSHSSITVTSLISAESAKWAVCTLEEWVGTNICVR